MYDLYLRENVKSRPKFAGDQGRYKAAIRKFFEDENKNPRYLKGYEGYDSRQMGKMAHIEVMSDGKMILFDYRSRNHVSSNGEAVAIGIWNGREGIIWQNAAEKGENRSCIND